MADSADLVVLGAWYGSGNRGGKISIFLMGCYDQNNNKWKTVTKVHTGHDDGKKQFCLISISKIDQLQLN